MSRISHRRDDFEGVVALYDGNAVLWSTRSPTIRDNPTHAGGSSIIIPRRCRVRRDPTGNDG